MKKKFTSLRISSGIIIATLLTTSLIGGTFAKFTTGVNSSDSARSAYWGFSATNSIDLGDLFKSSYTHVESRDSADIIAPGTNGSVDFSFKFDTSNGSAPEVDYSFTINVTDTCSDSIKTNPDIQFKLDDGSWGSWDNLVNSIKALAGESGGTKNYTAGTLPTFFNTTKDTHTISWQWLFEDATKSATQDAADTALGNAATLPSCSLSISIAATQID